MNHKVPNFVVIGAPKSGTTSLYFYLKQHPEIYLPDRKELHYFAYDLLARNMAGPGDRDILPALCATRDHYLSHYQQVKSQRAIGEVSPSYLYYHQVAGRIRDELSEVKIIALLRNPIEKAYSQYLHLVREYRETKTFSEALLMEEQRMSQNWSDLWLYASSSLYFAGVKHYLSTFGMDHVMVILSEDFFADPGQAMKRVFQFLGVDPSFRLDEMKIYNKSGKSRSKILSGVLSRPSGFKDRLKKMLPASVQDRIWFALQNLNTGKKEAMDRESREYLSNFFRDDITRLEDLLGFGTNWL